MDKAMLDEIRDYFDARYKLKEDCNKEMDEVNEELANGATQFAVINTKLSEILWLLGVLGTAIIGVLVKLVFKV